MGRFAIKAYDNFYMGEHGYIIYDIIDNIDEETACKIAIEYSKELIEESGLNDDIEDEANELGVEYEQILNEQYIEYDAYKIKEEFKNIKKSDLLDVFMENEMEFMMKYCEEL